MSKIAIVRVRGIINTRKEIESTMKMLHLHNKNYAVVVEDTPQNKGMISKVKDFVTFGPLDEETFKEMVSKRGEEYTGRLTDSKGKIEYKTKYVEVDGKKYKKFFRLSPPKKGYGAKGIKQSFVKGGALGNRGEKMSDLIKRMI